MDELSLDGVWSFMKYPQGITETDLVNLDFSDAFKADVPGCVHTDLMANGEIPDPFKGLNELDVQWVEKESWVYMREFDVAEELLSRDRAELAFEGLDTFATVYLNGAEIGKTDNMFIPWRFSVGKLLKPKGNRLVIAFDSPVERATSLEKRYGVFDAPIDTARVQVRKCQCHFGWDWGPRLATSGIWRSVRLHFYTRARIRRHHITFHRITKARASGEVEVDVRCYKKLDGAVEVRLSCGDGEFAKNVFIKFKKGKNLVRIPLAIKNPKRWYPNGYGNPDLYDVEITLKEGEAVLHRVTDRTGIRKVQLMRTKDKQGEKFYFKINGVAVYSRGANWIPADSFLPRISKDHYRRLIEMARDAGVTMLRIWGGGIYEDDAFYNLCDEMGIMLWHDFMFACGKYPENPPMVKRVKREAERIVRRLRHHPSIVLWCGNNENQWAYAKPARSFPGNTYYEKILPRVCSRLDGARPYWPGSPYGGRDPNDERLGDRHNWEVWSNWRYYTDYLKDNGRFISEFGFQGFPAVKTFEEYLDTSDAVTLDTQIEHHNKQVQGMAYLYRFVFQHFRVTEDWKKLAYFSQLVQAEALKTGVEHFRRRKFDCGGALIWQWNDCWPVVSWAMIDYKLRPKASYFWSKKFFAPELVSMWEDGQYCYVHYTNDRLETRSLKLYFTVRDYSGKVLVEKKGNFTVAKNGSKRLMRIPLYSLPLEDRTNAFIHVVCKEGAREVAENALFLTRYKFMKLTKAKIALNVKKRRQKKYELTLSADTFAKGVWVDMPGEDFSIDDNYFDILGDSSRAVTLKTEKDYSDKELKSKLTITCYNNVA